MIPFTLEKFLSKKEVFPVLKDILNSVDSAIDIQDTDGRILISSHDVTLQNIPEKRLNKYPAKMFPVEIEGMKIGRVIGNEKAQSIASLITYMANKEYEKKMLISDTLGKYKEIALLYGLAEKIVSCFDLTQIAGIILDEAKKLIRASGGSIMLEKNGRLEILSAFGAEYFPKLLLKKNVGIAGKVLATGRGEIINDVILDQMFVRGEHNICSLMCVPLKVNEHVIGVLNISSDLLVAYTAEDLKILNVLATQAAFSIENAILYKNKFEQERMKSNLQRYIAPQIVETLINDVNGISLKPAKRKIAILFSDIRSFSSLCEKLSPEKIVMYLNEYFSQMVNIIFDQNGTINKFVGDMIVAFFGAPIKCEECERSAILTAIGMQTHLRKARSKWIRKNFKTGIGISTGNVVIGNIGSPHHMDYTAIGDEVNIADRLQSIAKGGQILVEHNVQEATKNEFSYKKYGNITVKGKTNPIEVYEVIY